jgi:hypothetical protein
MSIIAKVNTQYLLQSQKFGIESVEDALAIDRSTNTMYWKDAIDLEIKNVEVESQDLKENEKAPVGYQQIRCHSLILK